MNDDLTPWQRQVIDALTHLRAGCHEEVTRTDGVLDACGRAAVAVYRFPGSDQAEPSTYPVCARHIRRQGMIPLADLLADNRATHVAQEEVMPNV